MSDDLRAALDFLRKRLVGVPPNVDAEDVWMASLLDEAEAIGRAALATSDGLTWETTGIVTNEVIVATQKAMQRMAEARAFGPVFVPFDDARQLAFAVIDAARTALRSTPEAALSKEGTPYE